MTKQDGEMDYNIKRFIRHENYNRITFANDIALVEVNQNIAFSDLVRPACLSGDNALGVDKFIAVILFYIIGSSTIIILHSFKDWLGKHRICRKNI